MLSEKKSSGEKCVQYDTYIKKFLVTPESKRAIKEN